MPPPWENAYNFVVCPPKATKLKATYRCVQTLRIS